MVKKSKPPSEIPEGKRKVPWGMIAAIIGLLVMVISVWPGSFFSSSQDEGTQPQSPSSGSLNPITAAFSDKTAEPMNASQVNEILLENKTFIRHFFGPRDEMFSALQALDSLESVVVERISFDSYCGSGSQNPNCPSSAPATLIYLPNSTEQPVYLSGVVSLERLEGFMHGTIVPQVSYSFLSCGANCSLSELVSILTPISNVSVLNSSSVYPALVINPQDLSVRNFGSVIDQFYKVFRGEVEVYSVNESAIVFTTNPHTLSSCSNSSSLDVFYSPRSPPFEGYSTCPLDANVQNCTQISNTSCAIFGENPSCNFTQGQRQFLSDLTLNATVPAPTYLCVPMSQADLAACANVSDSNATVALLEKYSVRSLPTFVFSSGCKESVYSRPFASASALRAKACEIFGC